MPERNFLLQKDIQEKTTKEQKIVKEKLKKLVEEQQNILHGNEIKCEEYHTAIEISRKIERFFRFTY